MDHNRENDREATNKCLRRILNNTLARQNCYQRIMGKNWSGASAGQNNEGNGTVLYMFEQTSRLVSDCILPRLHRWSLATLDCLSSVNRAFPLPHTAARMWTVCQTTSLQHLRWVSSIHASNATFSSFPSPSTWLDSARAVTCHSGHFSLSYYLLKSSVQKLYRVKVSVYTAIHQWSLHVYTCVHANSSHLSKNCNQTKLYPESNLTTLNVTASTGWAKK